MATKKSLGGTWYAKSGSFMARQSAQETWWALSGLGLFFFLGDLALRRFHGQLRA